MQMKALADGKKGMKASKIQVEDAVLVKQDPAPKPLHLLRKSC